MGFSRLESEPIMHSASFSFNLSNGRQKDQAQSVHWLVLRWCCWAAKSLTHSHSGSRRKLCQTKILDKVKLVSKPAAKIASTSWPARCVSISKRSRNITARRHHTFPAQGISAVTIFLAIFFRVTNDVTNTGFFCFVCFYIYKRVLQGVYRGDIEDYGSRVKKFSFSQITKVSR